MSVSANAPSLDDDVPSAVADIELQPTNNNNTNSSSNNNNEPTNDDVPVVAARVLVGDPDAPRGDKQLWNDLPPDVVYSDERAFDDDINLKGDIAYATYGPDDQPPQDITKIVQEYEAKGYTLFQGKFKKFMNKDSLFRDQVQVFRAWYVPGSKKRRAEADVFAGGDLKDFKPKSLFLALSFMNPFDKIDKKKPPHVPTLVGYEANGNNPVTLMKDDDFLKVKGHFGGDDAPNRFQKLIEMLLRMRTRGLTVLPPDVLAKAESAPEGEAYNFFGGYTLVEKNLLTSPDKDEVYFEIHAKRDVLIDFAAQQGLTLQTNKYSFGGGGGMIYTKKLDFELTKSVQDYMKHFTIAPEDAYCKGKYKEIPVDDDDMELGADGKPVHDAKNDVPLLPNQEKDQDGRIRDFNGWGFCIEVPQKQRLLLRMLREGWQFGGCGLQLDEMKEKGGFLINYYVMHNKMYQKDYGLDRWGSYGTLVCSPMMVFEDWEQAITLYYGESVAIYFCWMRRYIAFLVAPAIVGLACGLAQQLSNYAAAIGGAYAIFLVIWAILWQRSWQRFEQRFSMRWGQEIESKTELVRDEFHSEDTRHVNVERIFSMDFEYPLTMQRLADGTMVELYYPSLKRNLIRYGVSYPLMVLLASAMAAALFFIEYYRLQYRDDNTIAVGASILSVITLQLFNRVSTILIALLNDAENPRTDSEWDNEQILKSFAFQFISTYFSVGVILLWPGVANDVRQTQLKTQMVTQICIMPLVGNLIEIILPKIMTGLKRRSDVTGNIFSAICSYFCCCECSAACSCYYSRSGPNPRNERELRGIELWKAAQKEVYVSTAADYLEVVLVYGYTLLFACVFPWAGIATFINTIIEVRVDAYKLNNEHQRPVARTSTGIGAFNDINFILLGLSLVTNSYIVTMIADGPIQLGMVASQEKRLEYFSFFQYFLVLAVLLLGVIRQPISDSVKKLQAKLGLLSDRAIQDYVKRQLALSPVQMKKLLDEAAAHIAATEKEKGMCSC